MNQSKIIPVRDLMLVKLDPREEVTKSGIIIPDVAKHPKRIGTIVAVGEQCDAMFKKGVRILVSEFSGDDLKASVEGVSEDLKLIPQEDVQGIVVSDSE